MSPQEDANGRTNASVRILVVDDDTIILDSLGEFLREEGHEVVTAAGFEPAVVALEEQEIHLVLCDVNMPGGNGFELLHLLRKRHRDVVVIMMTAYGTIESAVEAIKMGAYDYLTKPIIDDELRVGIERAIAQQAILRENKMLRDRLDQRFGLRSVIGHDYRMLKLFDLVESVAASRVTVLVCGASGTGKSLIARVIHQISDRADRPFVEVACGAMPETLLESELFGHVRGAFTGAVSNKAGKFKAADTGTIFLDEISTASPALQVKLLRVLQSQEFEPVGSNKTERVDTRVVLATNLDLAEEVAAGRFREDLYYRINVVTLEVPSLADRIGDVPLLAQYFFEQSRAEMNRDITGFDKSALEAMQRYSWPGNVRELQNAIERAVVLARGRMITVDDLPPRMLDRAREEAIHAPAYEGGTLRDALEEPEKKIIESALRANAWNRQQTADQLGINRTTLYKKMKHYGLDQTEAAKFFSR